MTEEVIEEQAEHQACAHIGITSYKRNPDAHSLFKRGFRVGAKWGIEHAIEWHDLRKNPDDLPKLADKRFPWSITVSNQNGEACEYNYRLSRWQNCLASEIDEPIAWKELIKLLSSKNGV